MIPRIPGSHLQQLHDVIEYIAPKAPFWQVEEVVERIVEIVWEAKANEELDNVFCNLVDGFFTIEKG